MLPFGSILFQYCLLELERNKCDYYDWGEKLNFSLISKVGKLHFATKSNDTQCSERSS